ncbi:MAG: hypothetical protein ACOX7W_07965 [Christensenellales bacterium]|jgi:hypothetical protein
MYGQQPQLDSKNLSYLEDSMSYEALAVKKCQQYATQFQDPVLKDMASQLAQHHRQHYDTLLNYLQSHQ